MVIFYKEKEATFVYLLKTMSKTEGKLKYLAAQNRPSNRKEKVAYRKENKARFKKSTRISLRILDALDEKVWSRADLARALEVTPRQVTKILKVASDLKLSPLAKLEAVLGIQLH